MHSAPIIEVTYRTATGELAAVQVKAGTRVMTAYEMHSARKNWPPLSKAPNLGTAWMAWYALKTDGDTPADLETSSFESFSDAIEVALMISDGSVEDPAEEDIDNPLDQSHR